MFLLCPFFGLLLFIRCDNCFANEIKKLLLPMFPLIFCSLCAQKFWCVCTFLEMITICNVSAATHVQQYGCATMCLYAVNLCVCAVFESCVHAHARTA